MVFEMGEEAYRFLNERCNSKAPATGGQQSTLGQHWIVTAKLGAINTHESTEVAN
jgi:hypothetical protein